MINILKKIVRKLVNKIINKLDAKMLLGVSKVLNGSNITLLDIGAAGGIESRWAKISPLLNYIGFEPDERSNEDLTQSIFATSKIFKNPVWDHPGTLNINLTSKPQVSSFYTPNKTFVDLFPDSSRFNIECVAKLQSVKLDDLNLNNCDFIKLDIQGGELSVLKGAQNLLQKNIGLEIEVEFLHIYNDQPLFGEVVEFLRLHNYSFIDFVNLTRWERNAFSGFGQCVYGDALFLKMPEIAVEMGKADHDIIFKYLAICLLYNRFDLIDVVVEMAEEEQKLKMKKLLAAIKSIRANHNTVRRINGIATSFTRLLGGREYRSHVIY